MHIIMGAVVLGQINPIQLLEHHLFPGQNRKEKRAHWHNGKAACNPQLLMGNPAATQLLCALGHCILSVPDSTEEPNLLEKLFFAPIVRISSKQPKRCLFSRQDQGWVPTCAVSLQSRKLHAGFPEACPSRNPPVKPVAPG